MIDVLIALKEFSNSGDAVLEIRVKNRGDIKITLSSLPFTWARSHVALFDAAGNRVQPDANLPILNFGVYDTMPVELGSNEEVCISVKIAFRSFKVQWLHDHVFTLTPGGYFLCVLGRDISSNRLEFSLSSEGHFIFQ